MVTSWRVEALVLGSLVCALPDVATAERAQSPGSATPTPRTAPSTGCGLHPGDVFAGTYVCAQGLSDVRLHVLTVQATDITAVFDFAWTPGGITGSFRMRGTCDARSRGWEMSPDYWVVQPRGWIMVGMDGTLSADGQRYTGRMEHPSCGTFAVRRR